MFLFRLFPPGRRADRAALALLALLLGAVGAPLIAQTADAVRQKRMEQQSACATNLKQINLAMLMYSQDYNGKFPIARSRDRVDGQMQTVEWNDITSPYLKRRDAFRCPAVATNKTPLTYLYNDLASGTSKAAFAGPASTILVAEGEDLVPNVGHAYQPDNPPAPAVFARGAKVGPGNGARVQNAPMRHSGGANYSYVDGHVKWAKPEAVYFPSRSSNAPTARAAQPKPGGDMKGRAATFHVD